ncbi:membrane protein [Pseudomonas batumici]|uniref:membrane protein n=1 Tax=Pseudomonas batumici TaxID=226910 RepID=UPI000589BC5D|nr:membrane protein [Pseudomonas batumici]
MKLKRIILISAITVLTLPAAVLAFVKPLRVVAPLLIPEITCPLPNICTDSVAQLSNAQQLYNEGYATAATAVGPFRSVPRVVFCTTDACAESFGLGQRAAAAVGNVGLIVAPRGWKAFYLAHELIHYRQAETLGNLAVATQPKWLVEGMAYSLSGDPRHPLGPPFEQWRSQFETWHAGLGAQDIWDAARGVH